MSEFRRQGRSGGNDNLDCSGQSLTSLPRAARPNVVVTLNASNNLLKDIPDIVSFSALRYLDLSNNKFLDLAILESVPSLRELDISGNRLRSIDFCASLPDLEVLRASRNRIREISFKLPQNLIDLDLSNNEIASLDFMEKNVPIGIEKIDVSGNQIDTLVSLRFLAVFQQLHTFTVGLLTLFPGAKVLQYVKHLCPAIEYFDDTPCAQIEEPEFDTDKLIDILVNVDEQELESLLRDGPRGAVEWSAPTFIPFEDDVKEVTPIAQLQSRLKALEDALPRTPPPSREKQRGQLDLLISPYPAQDESQELKELRSDIAELKQQMAKVAELLYVHDQALRQIWEKGSGRK